MIKKHLKTGLEILPYSLGTSLIIPAARRVRDLFFGPISRRRRRKIKLNDEKEIEKIYRTVSESSITSAIIVWDLLVSPPTLGDYIYTVMLARYFIKHNRRVNLVIVNGNYRYDWTPLTETEKERHVSYLAEIGELILDSPSASVQVLTYKELRAKLRNIKSDECLIPFRKRVLNRQRTYRFSFNVLNQLASVADDNFIQTFLLSYDELAGKIKFSHPAKPYITWNCRYSDKWSLASNMGDDEFLQIYSLLKCHFPDHAIMVVSDERGCDHFRKPARLHDLDCIFSKDYSASFMGDGALILGSDFYYQYSGGGMSVFALFSTVPYEMYIPVMWEKYWQEDRLSSWASENQIFRPVPLTIQLHTTLPQRLHSL